MKKIFTTILAASMMLIAFNANAQLSAGAGYLNSNFSGQYNGKAIDPEVSNGFFVGAGYEIPIAAVNGLSIAPGAYFSLLSNKQSSSGSVNLPIVGTLSQSATTTFTEMAISVPVHAKYSFELVADTKLFAFVGPTFQLGLSSKYQTVYEGTVNSTPDPIDNYEDTLNKFNLFIGGGVGAQVSGIILKIGYDLGLLNLYKGDTDNTNYKRSNLYIGVGYAF